eukprot:1141661-Pelagomonas_calceolata.AAC.4
MAEHTVVHVPVHTTVYACSRVLMNSQTVLEGQCCACVCKCAWTERPLKHCIAHRCYTAQIAQVSCTGCTGEANRVWLPNLSRT